MNKIDLFKLSIFLKEEIDNITKKVDIETMLYDTVEDYVEDKIKIKENKIIYLQGQLDLLNKLLSI